MSHRPPPPSNPLLGMMNMMPGGQQPRMALPPSMRGVRPMRPPMRMMHGPPPPGHPPQHRSQFSPMNQRGLPTVLQVPSPAFAKMAASQHPPPPRNGGPMPPMIRPGFRPVMRHNRPPPPQPRPMQVRTVFVPPPMRMDKPSSAFANGSNYENGNQEEEEEYDDDDHIVIDEDELDDVEPDLDPQTNEVDDVEPRELVVRPPEERDLLPRGSSVQFVRRADGKGFAKKVIDGRTMDLFRSKKKKRKAFRGINYRFDGTRIKKRGGGAGKRPGSANDNAGVNGGDDDDDDDRDPSVLAYLGIQRKDAAAAAAEHEIPALTITRTTTSVGPKAKKSFKQPFGLPSSISISRYENLFSSSSCIASSWFLLPQELFYGRFSLDGFVERYEATPFAVGRFEQPEEAKTGPPSPVRPRQSGQYRRRRRHQGGGAAVAPRKQARGRGRDCCKY